GAAPTHPVSEPSCTGRHIARPGHLAGPRTMASAPARRTRNHSPEPRRLQDARSMSVVTPEQRLAAAGHRLPATPQPRGHYAPSHLLALPDGSHQLSVSGQTCRIDGVAVAGTWRNSPVNAAARRRDGLVFHYRNERLSWKQSWGKLACS